MGGSLLALVGVALVVYNGHFILKISPLGDFLTLLAAFSWAFYSLIMKNVRALSYDFHYPQDFLLRNTDYPSRFYPSSLAIFSFRTLAAGGLDEPSFSGCTCFSGLLCGVEHHLKQLGTVRASNYIYLNPLFTLIGSAVLLDEQFTVMSLMGAMLILGGVYWAGKR